MIDKIKSELFKQYKNDDIKWMFFSLFDKNKKLLVSSGVVKTDKTMDQLIDTFYASVISKYQNTKTVIVDLIKDLNQETDLTKMLNFDVKEYGFCLIHVEDWKTGAVLPNTQWIKNVKEALTYIKKKNQINGNVEIYSFKTDRVIISV